MGKLLTQRSPPGHPNPPILNRPLPNPPILNRPLPNPPILNIVEG